MQNIASGEKDIELMWEIIHLHITKLQMKVILMRHLENIWI